MLGDVVRSVAGVLMDVAVVGAVGVPVDVKVLGPRRRGQGVGDERERREGRWRRASC